MVSANWSSQIKGEDERLLIVRINSFYVPKFVDREEDSDAVMLQVGSANQEQENIKKSYLCSDDYKPTRNLKEDTATQDQYKVITAREPKDFYDSRKQEDVGSQRDHENVPITGECEEDDMHQRNIKN